MGESTPRPLEEILRELVETYRAGGEQTCRRCGEKWEGQAHELCWACEQAKLRADELRRLTEATIPPRWKRATFATYRCPPGDSGALAKVRRWGPESDRGLFLFGQPGAGKSHLAFALTQELARQGIRLFVADWTDLLRRLRKTYDGPGEHESEILAEVQRADVVIIDDLAAGRVTDWATDTLWTIVQTRYEDETPIVATCNLSLGDLARKLASADGDRIVSRLAEMCERIEVRARDYRLHGGGEA